MTTSAVASGKNRLDWALLILLLLLSPWFFWFGPDHDAQRSYQLGWNLGHIVFFALAALWLIRRRRLSALGFYRQGAVVLGVTLLLGGLIEWLQGGLARQSDVADLARNCLGAMLVLAWRGGAKCIARRWLTAIRAGLLLALAWQFYLPLSALLDEWRSTRHFPLLANFESALEMSRWQQGSARFSRSTRHVSSGQSALQVLLDTGHFSGIMLRYFPRDWRGYQYLSFDLYSDVALPITVRIHDQLHRAGGQLYRDRFNRRYALTPGWNTISIALDEVAQAPATRRMDLSAVAAVGWFVTDQPAPLRIFLDNVRLQ